MAAYSAVITSNSGSRMAAIFPETSPLTPPEESFILSSVSASIRRPTASASVRDSFPARKDRLVNSPASAMSAPAASTAESTEAVTKVPP